MNKPSDTAKALVLVLIASALAFRAGQLTTPPLIDHRTVLRLPRPNHVWIGFNPETRSAYWINNQNHLIIHGLSYRCIQNRTNGLRVWDVHFEESTTR